MRQRICALHHPVAAADKEQRRWLCQDYQGVRRGGAPHHVYNATLRGLLAAWQQLCAHKGARPMQAPNAEQAICVYSCEAHGRVAAVLHCTGAAERAPGQLCDWRSCLRWEHTHCVQRRCLRVAYVV